MSVQARVEAATPYHTPYVECVGEARLLLQYNSRLFIPYSYYVRFKFRITHAHAPEERRRTACRLSYGPTLSDLLVVANTFADS